MSFRLYYTRLKCLFRNKEGMFWCYMFPILLTTCLYLAASKIGAETSFDTIKIAYDNQGVQVDEFGSVLQAAKLSNDKKMFDITISKREEARELLDKGTVEAYIIGSTEPELFIKENGLNETILKAFLDSYRQMQSTIHNILSQNPAAINEGLIDDVMNYKSFINEVDNQKKPDNILIFFYAIMAFNCIFAANWGLDEVINIQADQSLRGARVNVSPINKMKLFLCNMLAAFSCHILSVILLFLYMNYVLNINFGDNLLYLFIICFIGSLAGLSMGACIGVWIKKKAEVKEAILTAVVMGGGFLSGMMSADVKYYVAEKFPLLAYINPVNLVTDAMYSLYYFDTYKRFYLDAILLLIIMVVLMVASYLGIRRKNYASI